MPRLVRACRMHVLMSAFGVLHPTMWPSSDEGHEIGETALLTPQKAAATFRDCRTCTVPTKIENSVFKDVQHTKESSSTARKSYRTCNLLMCEALIACATSAIAGLTLQSP